MFFVVDRQRKTFYLHKNKRKVTEKDDWAVKMEFKALKSS